MMSEMTTTRIAAMRASQLNRFTPVLTGQLGDLLAGIDVLAVEGPTSVTITSLCTDSRQARRGCLFFAVPGIDQDGAGFLTEAVARGAVAVVVEGGTPAPAGASVVRVVNCRLAKALMAARFFGHPSRRLPVVGVTGTNGKTTTSHLLRSIAEYDGGPTVLIGTIAHEVGQRSVRARNTTPDPIELESFLTEGLLERARLGIMEVSSHALVQERVAGIDFRAAVFTNLSPEHLDYHGTLEAYQAAKLLLFENLDASAVAVLNADDPVADVIAAVTRARVLRYGLSCSAEISADIRRVDADGTAFILKTPYGDVDVNTRLLGRHNLMNCMAAGAAALAMGYPLDSVRGGFQLLKCVPGRLESIHCGQDFRVLVDYAHTHDALQKVLENLRPLTRGRLITVFGCGGDRDRAKRPLMGRVAANLSDVAVLTSDNPRGEDPREIIEEVLAGIPEGRPVIVEADRRRAIETALRMAQSGDLVTIAGKGHEVRQLVGGRSIEFDDRAVAREVLWSL
jgi:UDP-N-acetylmuramoyl-L-alanyl-D-glutamate--2,6-diaminopimelate ligase